MEGISHEQYPLYCNQPYTAMTATPPRHLQYAAPLPQFPSPATAPPLSLPSTTHPIYYNMSHVQGGSFPISRCSPTEPSTVCPASPYSVVSHMHTHYMCHTIAAKYVQYHTVCISAWCIWKIPAVPFGTMYVRQPFMGTLCLLDQLCQVMSESCS